MLKKTIQDKNYLGKNKNKTVSHQTKKKQKNTANSSYFLIISV